MPMYATPAQVIVKQTRGLQPLYPINIFYRLIPAVGLCGVAFVWNAVTPQYIRLPERLKNNAFTYMHPVEIQMAEAEKAKKAAAAAAADDEE